MFSKVFLCYISWNFLYYKWHISLSVTKGVYTDLEWPFTRRRWLDFPLSSPWTSPGVAFRNYGNRQSIFCLCYKTAPDKFKILSSFFLKSLLVAIMLPGYCTAFSQVLAVNSFQWHVLDEQTDRGLGRKKINNNKKQPVKFV